MFTLEILVLEMIYKKNDSISVADDLYVALLENHIQTYSTFRQNISYSTVRGKWDELTEIWNRI